MGFAFGAAGITAAPVWTNAHALQDADGCMLVTGRYVAAAT